MQTLTNLLSDAPAQSTGFRPGEIWRDTDGAAINAHGGGLFHHDGVTYWYGEHKIEGKAGNTAQVGVSVYSSRDLLHWKNEGIALSVSDDASSDIARGCILERPKVIYNARTKRFVMWFHLELLGQGYNSARVGVAVSDSPTGPFTFVHSFRPDKSMSRDLTLFADDDASRTAYLFTASEDNKTLHISRLSDDYLTTAGEWVKAFPGRYMEAPAVFKHNGKYWFVGSGCTGWEPNAARSAVADHPLGPWTELENPCIGAGAERTFESQSTYVLPVPGGKSSDFIFLADRWNPENAIDGRYVWLPIDWQTGETGDAFTISWHDAWDLGYFDR